MSQTDDAERLRHMLDHAREAVEMCGDRRRADLDHDRKLNLAVVRLLEIVGEAAAHVSQPTQRKLAKVPWALIVGLRNRLIHGYSGVDLDVVWATVTNDLPKLAKELEQHLGVDS